MTRSARVTPDWNGSMTALLVIGSIRLLNEAAARSRTEEPTGGFMAGILAGL